MSAGGDGMNPAPTITLAHAEELDRTDPLAAFRDRYLPTPDEVVADLDGNSLGRPLRAIGESWQQFTNEQWAGRLIRGWSEECGTRWTSSGG